MKPFWTISIMISGISRVRFQATETTWRWSVFQLWHLPLKKIQDKMWCLVTAIICKTILRYIKQKRKRPYLIFFNNPPSCSIKLGINFWQNIFHRIGSWSSFFRFLCANFIIKTCFIKTVIVSRCNEFRAIFVSVDMNFFDRICS